MDAAAHRQLSASKIQRRSLMQCTAPGTSVQGMVSASGVLTQLHQDCAAGTALRILTGGTLLLGGLEARSDMVSPVVFPTLAENVSLARFNELTPCKAVLRGSEIM